MPWGSIRRRDGLRCGLSAGAHVHDRPGGGHIRDRQAIHRVEQVMHLFVACRPPMATARRRSGDGGVIDMRDTDGPAGIVRVLQRHGDRGRCMRQDVAAGIDDEIRCVPRSYGRLLCQHGCDEVDEIPVHPGQNRSRRRTHRRHGGHRPHTGTSGRGRHRLARPAELPGGLPRRCRNGDLLPVDLLDDTGRRRHVDRRHHRGGPP